MNTLEFLAGLQNRKLNEGNKKRLEEIVSRITNKEDVYIVGEYNQEKD